MAASVPGAGWARPRWTRCCGKWKQLRGLRPAAMAGRRFCGFQRPRSRRCLAVGDITGPAIGGLWSESDTAVAAVPKRRFLTFALSAPMVYAARNNLKRPDVERRYDRIQRHRHGVAAQCHVSRETG